MEEKIAEYFEIKGTIKTLREDLKEMIEEHELTEQIDQLKKDLKELREKLAEQEDLQIIKDKIKTLQERQDLIKEIILVEMRESGQEKVEYQGNEILITQALKFKRIKRK